LGDDNASVAVLKVDADEDGLPPVAPIHDVINGPGY
jgi:hypothetical protein